MFGRRFLLLGVITAAIAIPYYLSQDTPNNPIGNWWDSMWTTTDAVESGPGVLETAASPLSGPTTANYGAYPPRGNPLAPNYGTVGNSPLGPSLTPMPGSAVPPVEYVDATRPPLSGPTVACLCELLRFDISHTWVMDNWSRVSTQLGDTDLQGLRVTLVSGTAMDDLAGSLTYYFDTNHQLQRISFVGNTGDPIQLVTLMTQQYGLQAEPALGGGLYLDRRSGEPTAGLRVRFAPVIRASDPRQRYDVKLELNRPGTTYGLSDDFDALLAEELRAKQWQPADAAKLVDDAEKAEQPKRKLRPGEDWSTLTDEELLNLDLDDLEKSMQEPAADGNEGTGASLKAAGEENSTRSSGTQGPPSVRFHREHGR